ncbi:MAG: PAS domain S-box protein [Kiritimatiellae bacterium]|jgi:PAS domain S-box-containing protein|nr:PAS domain S-box protein [Kiritimatiellia bacterium]
MICHSNATDQNSKWLDFTDYYIYTKFFKLHFNKMDLDDYITMDHKTIALVSGGEGSDIFKDWASSVDTYYFPTYFHDHRDCYKSFKSQESTSMLLESLYDNDEELINSEQYSVIIISTSHPKIGFRKSLDPSIKKTFDTELQFLHETPEGMKILNDIFCKYQLFRTYRQELSTVFFNCFLFFMLMVFSQAVRLFENYGMRYSSVTWGIVFSLVTIMLFVFGVDINCGYLSDLIKVLICIVTLFYGFFAGLVVLFVSIIYKFYTCDQMFVIPVLIMIISYVATLLLRKVSLKRERLLKFNTQLYVSNKCLLMLLIIMLVTSIINLYAQGTFSNAVFTHRIVFPFFALLMFITILVCILFNEVISKGRMTESLLKNESMLRTLLYSIGDGVIAVDTESKILFVNKVALRLTGWSEEDVIGLDIGEVFVVVNSQTNERLPTLVDQVLVTRQVAQQECESVLISKDNKRCYISDAVTPIVENTKELPSGAVIVFRDVTEKIETSAKLKEREELFNEAQKA